MFRETVLNFAHTMQSALGGPGALLLLLAMLGILYLLTDGAMRDGRLGKGWTTRLAVKTCFIPWPDDDMRELEHEWCEDGNIGSRRLLAFVTAFVLICCVFVPIASVMCGIIVGGCLSALLIPVSMGLTTDDHIVVGTIVGVPGVTILLAVLAGKATECVGRERKDGRKRRPDVE